MVKSVANAVTGRGGVVRTVKNLGVRKLAHRMRAYQKQNYEGRIMQLHVYSSPQGLADAEHSLKLNEDVVRFMTIKHKALSLKKAPRVRPPAKLLPHVDPQAGFAGPLLDYVASRELFKHGKFKPSDIMPKIASSSMPYGQLKDVKQTVSKKQIKAAQAQADAEVQAEEQVSTESTQSTNSTAV
jgi:ribosomal protein S6